MPPPPPLAANFATVGVDFPRPYDSLRFRFQPGVYSAPAGGDIEARFSAPADWEPPVGSAVDFVVAGNVAYEGSGAVTVEIVAAGTGMHYLPAGVGTGAVAVEIIVAGIGMHGVAGTGGASVVVGVSSDGGHGVAGFGVVSAGVSAAGTGVVQRYEVRGEVRIQGVLVDRLVRAYRRDTGDLVGEANTVAGRFSVHCGFEAREHYLVPIHLVSDAEDWAPPCANRVVSALAQDAW